MKIAHIAYFGRYGKITGIVEAVTNMTESQRKLGHEVRTYIPFKHPLQDGKKVFYIESFKYLIHSIWKYKPDIVVFDGFYDKYQIRMSFLLKCLRIPYVIVFHGGASSDNAKKNWLKKRVANILFFNRFVRWANRVVYLSENEKSKSVFHKCNPYYSIIPNGVNLPNNLVFKINEGRIRILFFSRLDWYGKGLDVLNQALEMLFKKGYGSKIEFLFYGSKESKECDELFRYDDMTKYCGYVTGREKELAYRDADLFILPSRSEGMPIAVLEALSYGLPCIVTPETNMASIIENGHCGWVVNLNSQTLYETFKSIINKFYLNHEQYFYNSIEASKQFDWKVIAEESIKIYNKVISNE